jgi:hypothetical protein
MSFKHDHLEYLANVDELKVQVDVIKPKLNIMKKDKLRQSNSLIEYTKLVASTVGDYNHYVELAGEVDASDEVILRFHRHKYPSYIDKCTQLRLYGGELDAQMKPVQADLDELKKQVRRVQKYARESKASYNSMKSFLKNKKVVKGMTYDYCNDNRTFVNYHLAHVGHSMLKDAAAWSQRYIRVRTLLMDPGGKCYEFGVLDEPVENVVVLKSELPEIKLEVDKVYTVYTRTYSSDSGGGLGPTEYWDTGKEYALDPNNIPFMESFHIGDPGEWYTFETTCTKGLLDINIIK